MGIAFAISQKPAADPELSLLISLHATAGHASIIDGDGYEWQDNSAPRV